jgi:hypothetical protein
VTVQPKKSKISYASVPLIQNSLNLLPFKKKLT